MDVGGSVDVQNGAAHPPAAGGDHVAALAFHGVPGIAADHRQLEPAAGLDLLDHGAQRIGVGGEGAGGIVRLALPAHHQGALAGAVERQPGEGLQGGFGEGNGGFSVTGGAGGVQQPGEEGEQSIGINGWQHGVSGN